MDVVFYGNCQAEATAAAFRARHAKVNSTYLGNSNRVAHYDPERADTLLEAADLIVTQPIFNLKNPEHHKVMRDRFGQRMIFMPYIYVDGLHALSMAGAGEQRLTRKTLFGGDLVLGHLRAHGLKKTVRAFRTGQLDLQHKTRFETTMAELRRREEGAGVEIRIAAEIEAHYRDWPVMLTHNHPAPELVNILAGKVSDHLGLPFTPIAPDEVQAYMQMTLPVYDTLITPWCQQEMGLSYPYDLQWFRRGRQLIRRLAQSYDLA